MDQKRPSWFPGNGRNTSRRGTRNYKDTAETHSKEHKKNERETEIIYEENVVA